MGKNVGKNISKNVSSKYSQNLIEHDLQQMHVKGLQKE